MVVKFLPAIFAASVISLTSCQKDELSQMQAEATETTNANLNNETGVTSVNEIPGKYIVVYKDGSVNNEQQAEVQTNEILSKDAPVKGFKALGIAIKGFTAELSKKDAEKLAHDSRVELVEPDQKISLYSETGTTTTYAATGTQTASWGATRIGIGNGAATGRTAWIVDSGIQLNHPDLNVDVARSRSFLTTTTDPGDQFGHGTMVAGILAAKNNDFGVVGVAAGAKVVSLRVMDASGNGSISAVIAALNYVAINGRAGDVVNLSLGASPSIALDNAVLAVANKGIFITIAAGNSNVNSANYSPARVNHANVFTISGMRSDNTFMGISNWGTPVDYTAPGTGLRSTKINSTYGSAGGTSMASPHVAGILLLKGRNILSQGYVKNDPDGVADKIAKL